LKIDITKYVENMNNKFPVKLGKKDLAKTLAVVTTCSTWAKEQNWTQRDPRYFPRLWQKDYSFAKGGDPIFNKRSWYYVQESRIQIKRIGRR
jgi:hypothetical protein